MNNQIKESNEHYDVSKNYRFYLTENEKKDLSDLLNRYDYALGKWKNSLSSIIKIICLNTYLYLNDINTNTSKDIKTILTKTYYKNLSKEFIETFKKTSLELDFFKELVRTEVLRFFTEPDEYDHSPLVQIQIRFSEEDEDLMRIIFGSFAMSTSEYMESLIRFFLNQNGLTRFKIINYEKLKKLKLAIKNNFLIIYHKKKYKPIKIITNDIRFSLLRRDYILCIGCENNKLELIDYSRVTTEIDYTMEEFTLNSHEEYLIDLFTKNKTVKIKFDIMNKDNNEINDLITKDTIVVLNKKVVEEHVELEIYNKKHIIEKFNNAYKNNDIKNLWFNKEYVEYKELINL